MGEVPVGREHRQVWVCAARGHHTTHSTPYAAHTTGTAPALGSPQQSGSLCSSQEGAGAQGVPGDPPLQPTRSTLGAPSLDCQAMQGGHGTELAWGAQDRGSDSDRGSDRHPLLCQHLSLLGHEDAPTVLSIPAVKEILILNSLGLI